MTLGPKQIGELINSYCDAVGQRDVSAAALDKRLRAAAAGLGIEPGKYDIWFIQQMSEHRTPRYFTGEFAAKAKAAPQAAEGAKVASSGIWGQISLPAKGAIIGGVVAGVGVLAWYVLDKKPWVRRVADERGAQLQAPPNAIPAR